MVSSNSKGRPPCNDVLTPAEWRVASLAQHGLKNRQIADKLNISINAVKYHIKNIREKLNLSHKTTLKQWFAIPANSVYQQEHIMTENIQIQGFMQISRTVSDIKAAEQWYRDVIGLTHLYTFDTLAFFDCGGVRLFLSEQADGTVAESILYLKVADIKNTYDALIDKGVVFTHTPHKVHTHADGKEEWVAFFEDPDKRPLALMSQVG
ncbi:LuxR C-terminal-related transcriptional regulator [Marinicella sp. W31]|uniref:LuxR C-terminal-related transcriptional regulator n=1 Tax=Marinicella sp. W31 TaxID=3023713 RepID=UPI003757DAB2